MRFSSHYVGLQVTFMISLKSFMLNISSIIQKMDVLAEFIHSFGKYSLSTYHLRGTLLSGDTV